MKLFPTFFPHSCYAQQYYTIAIEKYGSKKVVRSRILCVIHEIRSRSKSPTHIHTTQPNQQHDEKSGFRIERNKKKISETEFVYCARMCFPSNDI